MPNALLVGVGRRGGVAAEIAAGLATDGWDLALSYWQPHDQRPGRGGRSGQPSGWLAGGLRSRGRRVAQLPADLEDPAVPAQVVEHSVKRLGPLDALVLTHAESVDSGILDTAVDSFDRHYAINIRATWLLIAAFARQLPAGGGSIVAITGDTAVGNLPYRVTKDGLERLVLASASELREAGVRANVIKHRPIDTGWTSESLNACRTAERTSGRHGTPNDTPNLVRLLLSAQGKRITGQLLYSSDDPEGRVSA